MPLQMHPTPSRAAEIGSRLPTTRQHQPARQACSTLEALHRHQLPLSSNLACIARVLQRLVCTRGQVGSTVTVDRPGSSRSSKATAFLEAGVTTIWLQLLVKWWQKLDLLKPKACLPSMCQVRSAAVGRAAATCHGPEHCELWVQEHNLCGSAFNCTFKSTIVLY